MKKFFIFVLIAISFFVFSTINVYAEELEIEEYNPSTYSLGDDYKVDTRNKKQALYSIWRVFAEGFDSGNNQQDAFRFYYLSQLVENASNPTETQIIYYVNQCKIRYIEHEYVTETSNYIFNTLHISRFYDYVDTDNINVQGQEDFYMDESAFCEEEEFIYFSILVSESTRGYILNLLSDDSSTMDSNSETSEELTINEHNEKYPYNQIQTTKLSEGEIANPIIGLLAIIPFPWNLNETVHNYHGFSRNYNVDQTVYGYISGYQPISGDIDYVYLFFVVNLTMNIIDDDKLIIYYDNNIVCMTKEQHYYRYLNNETYQTLSEATNEGFTDASTMGIGNYFHQLGLFNEDSSNLSNAKYTKDASGNQSIRWPDSSYECIYDENGQIDTNPLVIGTFNFFNGLNAGHYAHDVMPYLLWGNSYNDNSTWLERIAWDCQSRNPYFTSWQTLRGNSLYEAYDASIFTKPFSTLEIVIIQSRLGDPL
ncbi:MAG: hypothetical protein JXR48_07395 [Candidatus Delongbacteria bacterium]|nr:hypothetical protein [Candidatus Delongbacteria bacterium]